VSSSDSVAVLSPYNTHPYTSHVDMTSRRCDDVSGRRGEVELQLQVHDVTSAMTSEQLRAPSTTSVYDNVTLDEMTQPSTATSRKMTSTSSGNLVVRRDDRMSHKRRESFAVGDNQQTPHTTDTRHHKNDDSRHSSTVRYYKNETRTAIYCVRILLLK